MTKTENRKNIFDRRAGDDRRRVYKLGYFVNGGVERRKTQDRRSCNERRRDWAFTEGCRSIKLG